MKTSYRAFSRRLLGGVAAGLLLTAAAHGEQIVLKVHHFLPATSNAQVNMIQPWCNKIAKESQDRMVCQIYPAMQLGGTPAQLFDQARDGVADIVWTLPTYAAGRFTKSAVYELPWLVPNAEAGSRALWEFTQKYALDEYKGVHPIFMHTHGGTLMHFVSKQPRTLADMKGLKIRSANRVNSQMLDAIGAVPVQMPLPAVPDSLAKGVVDGAAVPWEGVPAIKLDEISRYHLDVPQGKPRMGNSIFLFGMNQARYDSLPADLKKIIDDNSGADVSAWAGRTVFDEREAEFMKTSKENGSVFHYMDEAEYQNWVAATQGVRDLWIQAVDKKGGQGADLYAAARNLIKQYATRH
ncbi:TRAP transporter substrate-binding protein [uncultured Castellaniella sp.]|uniref:TRAP transporter substrate-binding protein n=1 Tax=uncultured Castellaniella sp. TaxID=647907 RepID=UPI002633C49C|nr:TRAP transporter substrate-binding protein [uncultured Castellaniella sp.]